MITVEQKERAEAQWGTNKRNPIILTDRAGLFICGIL
jgi:hypothetical protein